MAPHLCLIRRLVIDFAYWMKQVSISHSTMFVLFRFRMAVLAMFPELAEVISILNVDEQ